MDIIGSLHKSRTGKRYAVLVICNYASQYFKAVLLDADTLQEIKLVNVYSQLGVTQDILTDQGSNFILVVLNCTSMYTYTLSGCHSNTPK